jgi:hypothetical protein
MGKFPIVAATIGTFSMTFFDTNKFTWLSSIPSSTFPSNRVPKMQYLALEDFSKLCYSNTGCD